MNLPLFLTFCSSHITVKVLGSYLLPLLIPYGLKTCTKGCPAQEQDFLNVELTVCLFFAEVFELLLVRFLHCVF